MNILIVEDNKHLANSLNDIFTEKKYHVDIIDNGEDAIIYGKNNIYDLIIMDVMLPNMDGFSAVLKLREQNVAAPILMLTAKSEIDDKIIGLDCGADDYMTKPFSTKELLARVRALTRRKSEITVDIIKFGDISLNLSTTELSCKDKQTKLSHTEFELLKLFINNNNITLSKETIIFKVWGYSSDIEENNVEAYVSFIRKKLNFLDSNIKIKTIRKLGYTIEEGV